MAVIENPHPKLDGRALALPGYLKSFCLCPNPSDRRTMIELRHVGLPWYRYAYMRTVRPVHVRDRGRVLLDLRVSVTAESVVPGHESLRAIESMPGLPDMRPIQLCASRDTRRSRKQLPHELTSDYSAKQEEQPGGTRRRGHLRRIGALKHN